MESGLSENYVLKCENLYSSLMQTWKFRENSINAMLSFPVLTSSLFESNKKKAWISSGIILEMF